MKLFLIISGIVFLIIVIYSLFLVYHIYQSIEISEKIIAHSVAYTQHPADPDQYILVAGDSTAVGVGAVNPQESVAGRLGQQFPQADIINLGQSGATLKDVLALLQAQKGKHYDLIVLQIGANDITHFTPYPKIKEEISEILFLCNEMSFRTILLTSGDVGRSRAFHWPLSSFLTTRTLNVRHIFMEESSKYKTVSYIDLFRDKKDDPLEKDLKKYYAPDLFHLTGEGYGAWYVQIQKQL